MNKTYITTKTELIRYIESNFPDNGLRVEISKKFNLYNWLAITVISSCVSFLVWASFIKVIDETTGLTPSQHIFSAILSILLHGVVTGVIIKLLEFCYRYQIK